MGSALVTDVLSIRYGMDKRLTFFEVSTIKFLSHIVTIALIGIVLFGIMIFLSNPEQYLNSSKFLVKMTIVGVLIINGFLLHRFVFSKISVHNIITLPNYKSVRRTGFALGAISLVSWISALVLGILPSIPYSYGIATGAYVTILFLAIVIAILSESLLLEQWGKRT
jgi:hypothetical protein